MYVYVANFLVLSTCKSYTKQEKCVLFFADESDSESQGHHGKNSHYVILQFIV